ncbi:hypothetical protein Tco_1195431 [Tanacetum coccineum]
MDLLSCMKKKIGNGFDTSFWEEAWRGDSMFKVRFPRVYALELNKRITVADKLNHVDLGLSLRRHPRDGVELEQFNELKANIEGVELPLMKDRWWWSLAGSGEFSVSSVRKYIDDHQMIGLDIQSILCANCNKEVESTNHVFFACSMARDIYHKIASWWDINYSEFSSYEECFRNKSIFGSSIPSKAVIFDDLVSRSYYWCKYKIQNSCRVSEVLEVPCRVGPPSDLNAGSCTRAREVMIFCTIKSKPLALPWGRTPRLDSGVRPPDSIKNWADHFFWVDSRVFPISVPLYTGGVLEKDPAPHLTARQEQAVQVLSSNKAPFRRYPECFLALVGLSPYYPFGENTYPAFEGPDRTDMGLLDYIRTADPRKVQAVEVQKGEEQVTLFDSIKHCFVSLDAPAAAHQASGSGSGAGAEASAPSAEGNVVEENVIPEGAFLDLTDPECDVAVVEKDAQKQPEKAKRKKLLKRSDPLPAKRLRVDHPSLASGTGGKTLASLRRTLPEGSLLLGTSSPADIHTQVAVQSSRVADAPVYTTVDTVTSSRGKTLVLPTSDVGGSSQPETSEESADSFYETAALNSEDAKRWYVPRWNITNDSLLDDGFSCRTLVDRICLGSEVRSRTEHELELKEKLRAKYDARGVLLSEKDAEIARLKSLLKEKETESAEVLRLRNQVSVLAADKSSLSAEVSALKSDVSQKDTVISLLDSRASHLKSSLDDSQAACDEAKNLISSLSMKSSVDSPSLCLM